VDSGRPYKDILQENFTIREFDQNIDPIELKWHRDQEDRLIEVLEVGEGWKFQKDNELPIALEKGSVIFINKHHWHRVLKGNKNLKIKINEKL
tara:strand:- start:440 stop:718 length:279 start_codon:yes stop_codon:yes gene_type:complete